MYAIFDKRNHKVLRHVRHKPDMCVAIGHGEGSLFVCPDHVQARQLILEKEVWVGNILYMLEMTFWDISREERDKCLFAFKVRFDLQYHLKINVGETDKNAVKSTNDDISIKGENGD